MGSTERDARRVTTHALDEIRRGAGFRSRKLTGEHGAVLDPFVSFEHFHMWEPTFPPHPHAGLSAVTYLLERSEGALVSRESSGEARLIDPGAVRWMESGRGMMHEESPLHRGRDCHGLQILVNLAAADKSVAPRVFHLDPEQIPAATPCTGARLRVVCGEALGVRSPLAPLSAVTLLDVYLAPSVSLELAPSADQAAFVVPLYGSGAVAAGEDAASLAAHEAAVVLGAGRGGVKLCAGGAGLHVLLAAGRPLGEPVVIEGPFVMTSREAIAEAWARHAAGRMGELLPSSVVDAAVPGER